VSPSAKGLKLIVKTNADQNTHKWVFQQFSNYLKDNYSINTDKSGFGSSKVVLCFI